jgi:tetratricopeptide (TPR) repeat protein
MSISRAILRRIALAAAVGVAFGPASVRAQVLVWQSYQDAGRRAIERGCLDEAARLYAAAAEEVTRPGVHEPRKVATSFSDLAYVYTLQRNFAEAERLGQWALFERERLLGPIHREVGESLVLMGRIAVGQGRFAEAELPLRRALPILTKTFKTFEHPEVADDLELLADSLQGQTKLAEALALQEKALAIREQLLPNPDLTLDGDDPLQVDLGEQSARSLERTAALLRKAPCAATRADAIRKEADELDDRARRIRDLLRSSGPSPSPGRGPAPDGSAAPAPAGPQSTRATSRLGAGDGPRRGS